MKNQERDVAISNNYYLIEKWNDGSLSDEEILVAAKWNYRKFGFGYVSYDAYIEYKIKKRTCRLYNTNVQEWYRLLRAIFKRNNYTCFYCKSVGGKLEGDHKIPISKGGTNDIDNLVTACQKCNRQKRDKSVENFLAWRKCVYG